MANKDKKSSQKKKALINEPSSESTSETAITEATQPIASAEKSKIVLTTDAATSVIEPGNEPSQQSGATDAGEPAVVAQTRKPKVQEDALIGTALANRYEILSKLGEGGMSTVYKAQDLQLGRVVALKMVLPHLVRQEKNLKRFQREALSVRILKHNNIAEIYDSDVSEDGIPYINMEYIEGRTLLEVIEQTRFLPHSRAVPIFCQIADALQHAHTHGIIHRDLKPSNVLIRSQEGKDLVSIVDFGLAKLLPHADVQASTLTNTGDVFGSPPYMSPEQCRGEKVDSRTDIYSFGCLMYEALAGRPPLIADSAVTTILKQIETVPPPTIEVCPEAKVPATLEAILFKTMAKDPGHRQQSMSQILGDLNKFLSLQEAGLEYKPVSLTTKLSQFRLRHPKLTGWTVIIGTILLLWAMGEWWRWIHDFREGTFRMIGFCAITAVVGYCAYYAVRLNKKMQAVDPPTPIWQLPWHSAANGAPVAVSGEKTKDNSLQSFVARVEAGDSLGRTAHEELRQVLEDLVTSSCFEEVQNSSTHAIEVLRKQGKEKIETALLFKEYLADCLCAAKIFDRAEATYHAVLAGWEEFDSFSSEVRCHVQLKLADVLFFQQKVSEAEDLYTTFLARWDILELPHNVSYALRFSRLADCYNKAEKFKDAEETYRKVMELWQNIDPANSSLAFIKYVYTRMRCWRPIEGVNQFGKELESIERNFGVNSIHIVAAKSLYATCLWKEHDFPKAIEYRRSADNIMALRP